MKWVLSFLIVAVLFAFFGIWYLQSPGQVEITWFGYEYRSTAVVGVALLLFFFLLFYFLVRFLKWVISLPRRWVTSMHNSQDSKANQELLAVFTSYEAEMFTKALEHRKKAAVKLSKNPLFLWISGNVFEKSRKPIEAEQCYVDLTKNPATAFLGLKGEIRAALHRSDIKGALTRLEHAEKLFPNSPWVLKHLLALSREKKNYKFAEELTLRLEDLGHFTPEQSKHQIGHLHYLQAIDPDTSIDERDTLLRQAHLLDPSHKETTIVLAKLLFNQGHISYALSAIEVTWTLAPSQDLGDLYLEFSKPQNEVDAYQIATKFVQNSSTNPVSLLFLANTALNAKLWGEARNHLTKLFNQNLSRKVYELLARLELEEHQDVKAALKWLSLIPSLDSP